MGKVIYKLRRLIEFIGSVVVLLNTRYVPVFDNKDLMIIRRLYTR